MRLVITSARMISGTAQGRGLLSDSGEKEFLQVTTIQEKYRRKPGTPRAAHMSRNWLCVLATLKAPSVARLMKLVRETGVTPNQPKSGYLRSALMVEGQMISRPLMPERERTASPGFMPSSSNMCVQASKKPKTHCCANMRSTTPAAKAQPMLNSQRTDGFFFAVL